MIFSSLLFLLDVYKRQEQYMSICTHMQEMKKVCIRIPMRGTHIRIDVYKRQIEGFGFLPITCFSMALTTFISQNLGAKKYDRVKKGARFGIICSLILAELIGIILYITMPVLISAFNSDPEVIAYGTQQARTVTLFY